ncbi:MULTISPECIES: LPS translocon maturation chaperone LptM [Salinivibrio]|uniref:Lipoprotein n=1 Tax=Salinivibrio kushneri TaxID=1908198 RepID=A0AA47KKQ7_9GAMM|nr:MULTISPECIES: lipoprotein [Salinivibrio]WBA08588.1 lipoprotein [Salinivibrio kushneri]
MRKLVILLMFTGIMTLTGCGQQGPLYYPDEQPTQNQ